jgi:hypothetical protein
MTTEQEFRDIANNLVASMVGPDLVDAWWTTANRAFDRRTPETQWVMGSDQVVNYLMAHAFQGGGS